MVALTWNREALFATLTEALAGRAYIRLALMFGSYARGNASAGSDLDIAVLGQGIDPFALAAELSLVTGLEVDVVALEDAGVPLLDQIVRDGVVVHQGVAHAEGSWRAQTLAMLETDRSWYAVMSEAMIRRLAGERQNPKSRS